MSAVSGGSEKFLEKEKYSNNVSIAITLLFYYYYSLSFYRNYIIIIYKFNEIIK